MKKTVYVWVMFVLLIIGIISEAYSLFLLNAPLYDYLMNIISIVVYAVLAIKLFKLYKDAVRWVHIAFGWTAVGMIYNIVSMPDQGQVVTILITNIIYWAIFMVIWVTFVRHLNKLIPRT